MAAVIRTTHEEPVREIAQGVLLGTQFQHFIPEVPSESSTPNVDVHNASPSHDVHLEEMDLTYPVDVAGPSQASQYQSPPVSELRAYRRRRRRPTQLDTVDEGN